MFMRTHTVTTSGHFAGKTGIRLSFRLVDKRGVSNFGVRWRVSQLQTEGVRLRGNLDQPQTWQVSRQGAFETGFDTGVTTGRRRFHVPFISMTAGTVYDYRLRHGEPATPERIADLLRVSLQAWRDGKCDGVVTYCLDKRPDSPTFPPVQKAFHEFLRNPGGPPGGN